MANARGKKIDTTSCSPEKAVERLIIHRDTVLAHVWRWSYVHKFMLESKRYQTASILDVGCGVEMNLAKTMFTNKMKPTNYVGVDYNKIIKPPTWYTGSFPLEFKSQIDACDIVVKDDTYQVYNIHKEMVGEYKRPDIITNFEVLEHVEPEQAIRMLKKFREIMTNDSVALISTPCYNFKDCAANHVNEMTFEALGRAITDLGFGFYKVFGTFASQSDLIDNITPEEKMVWEKLKLYYDSNVLSNYLAPLYPQHSRNAMWVLTKTPNDVEKFLRKGETPYSYDFPSWENLKTPWTSSESWKDLAII